MRWRRSLAAALVAAALQVSAVGAIGPPVPTAQGYVTDTAGVIGPSVRGRIEAVVTELVQKTGAEIAVLTIDSTAPVDDLSYALQVAEAWKPGRKGDDTGVVVLVVTKDRKLRVVTGYGVEGILPDGLIGEIQDKEMLPSFKAGRMDEGIYRGVAALASRIAAARGVTLTGVPAPRPIRPRSPEIPFWVVVLIVIVLLVIIANSDGPSSRVGGRGGPPVVFFPGPTRFPGGWSDGGGGFGGFGGGGFGGGGAGRSW